MPHDDPDVTTADDARSSSTAGSTQSAARSPGLLTRGKRVLERGEIGRRLVHAAGVGFPLTYYVLTAGLSVESGPAWTVLQALTVVGVVAAAGLEFVRLRIGLDWWIFEQLTREYESEKVAGYALYLVGMAAVAVGGPVVASTADVAFPNEVALTGMFLLTLGDPLSGALADGTRDWKGPRAVVPALAFGTAVGYLVGLPIAAAVAAAVGLVIADIRLWSVQGYVIDDNLTIPIISAGLAWLVLLGL